MRFDNPIHDHGFVFPDIAEFPDVLKEERYIGNSDEEYIAKIKDGVKYQNLKDFETGYKWYMSKKPDEKLFQKLNAMFQFYNNFELSRIETGLPSNKIYDDLFENGISYLNVDVKELKDRLKVEIDNLLQQPDWRPPPGQFDRAKQLDTNIIKIVNDMFNSMGILQAATKYNKFKPLEVKNVVLHIAKIKDGVKYQNLKDFETGYKWFMSKKPDEKLFQKLNAMFQFYNNFELSRIETGLPSNKIYEDLFENGISYLTIDVKELKDRLKVEIDNLLQQPDWRPPPGKFDRAKQLDVEIVNLVNEMFKSLGILQAASKYNKFKPLEVKNVVLHIAKPTDQNYKQFLYDCKTVSKTTNLHIDPKENVMKAMMYLNNITEDDGPFSYIEKSNRWVHDKLQNIFGRAISTGSYCHTPESRAVVFQLPKRLRVSHNFGRLLQDGTEEQERLLKQEKMFTSDKGNLCIFDPAGMHRGGICNKGNRIALQILMK